eukprot:c30636_g1_i1 orf=86-322(-)
MVNLRIQNFLSLSATSGIRAGYCCCFEGLLSKPGACPSSMGACPPSIGGNDGYTQCTDNIQLAKLKCTHQPIAGISSC